MATKTFKVALGYHRNGSGTATLNREGVFMAATKVKDEVFSSTQMGETPEHSAELATDKVREQMERYYYDLHTAKQNELRAAKASADMVQRTIDVQVYHEESGGPDAVRAQIDEYRKIAEKTNAKAGG